MADNFGNCTHFSEVLGINSVMSGGKMWCTNISVEYFMLHSIHDAQGINVYTGRADV